MLTIDGADALNEMPPVFRCDNSLDNIGFAEDRRNRRRMESREKVNLCWTRLQIILESAAKYYLEQRISARKHTVE